MSGGERNRRVVRFLLNGEPAEVAGVNPNRTLLGFLREDRGLTGTKEGCAEGDCGACTLVVAEAVGGRLRARAFNACIALLPTLDGKAIYTVEGLSNDTLHPVQRAIVKCHGAQCGFCTPGFVMSLFALYKTNPSPTRGDIEDALAGNLCRCTGYRPIVDAAYSMYDEGSAGGDWLAAPAGSLQSDDEAEVIAALASLTDAPPLEIDTEGGAFHAPASVEALAALLATWPDATLLAGGTDLGLELTKALRTFDRLIYTGGVSELLELRESEDVLDIGAAVTLTDAMRPIVAEYPALGELFRRFASPPLRNVATLGGNIANASPIGDSMPALMVLGAELVLTKAAGSRVLPLEDFFVGYRETALEPGEFVERIRIPCRRDGDQVAGYKVSKRFDQDISAVCSAFRLRLDGGRVEEIRIACGGMAAVPLRARHAEAALVGQPWRPDALDAALDALDDDFRPISDLRASDTYRREVCRNLLRRFCHESGGLSPVSVYRYAR